MDLETKQYLSRASNELKLAAVIEDISKNIDEKERLGLDREDTFYSAVISHSYYAIFYSAKAILLTKNIKTYSPEIHKKTLEEFKKNFVDSGILDVELLKIYSKMIIRADDLLELFQEEKRKRGNFTYKTIPQANIGPAEESITNAKKFASNIKKVIER